MKKKDSLFDKDLKIKVFGIGWWFYMILTALGLLAVSLLGKNMDEQGKMKLVLVLSIIEYIVLRIYKFSLKHIRSNYNYWNELPCYLCNQSTLMCILASLTGNIPVMSYCVTIGTLGALLAVFMPDSYNKDQPFYSKQALGFYGYHGLLIISCLSFYTLGLYKPRLIHTWWGMLFTFLLACLAHVINIFMIKTGLNPGSNYVFTMKPDNYFLQKMYDAIHIRLLYLIPLLLILGVLSFVMLALFGLII